MLIARAELRSREPPTELGSPFLPVEQAAPSSSHTPRESSGARSLPPPRISPRASRTIELERAAKRRGWGPKREAGRRWRGSVCRATGRSLVSRSVRALRSTRLRSPRSETRTSRRYRVTRSTRIEIRTKIALDLYLPRLFGLVSSSSSSSSSLLSSLSLSSLLLLLSFREKCVGTVCPPFFTPGDSTHPGDRGDARASSRTSTIDLTPVREHRVARVDDPREARFLSVNNDRRLLALDRKIRTSDRWDAGEATRSSHRRPGECGKFLLGGSAGR